MVSEESLRDLNTKLQQPVNMTHFRPNIVVRGCLTPWAEDSWKGIISFTSKAKASARGIGMKVITPCRRCKVPTIDTETGVFDTNNQPIRTMKSFRTGEAIGLTQERSKKEVLDRKCDTVLLL